MKSVSWRPYNNNFCRRFLEALQNSLSEMLLVSNVLVCLEDFNHDFLVIKDSTKNLLSSTLESFGLRQVIGDMTTYKAVHDLADNYQIFVRCILR